MRSRRTLKVGGEDKYIAYRQLLRQINSILSFGVGVEGDTETSDISKRQLKLKPGI